LFNNCVLSYLTAISTPYDILYSVQLKGAVAICENRAFIAKIDTFSSSLLLIPLLGFLEPVNRSKTVPVVEIQVLNRPVPTILVTIVLVGLIS